LDLSFQEADLEATAKYFGFSWVDLGEPTLVFGVLGALNMEHSCFFPEQFQDDWFYNVLPPLLN